MFFLVAHLRVLDRIELSSAKPLFFFIGTTRLPSDANVSDYPENDDGFLYLKYGGSVRCVCARMRDILGRHPILIPTHM